MGLGECCSLLFQEGKAKLNSIQGKKKHAVHYEELRYFMTFKGQREKRKHGKKKIEDKTPHDNLTHQIIKIFNPILKTPLILFAGTLGFLHPQRISLCSLPSPPPLDFHLGWWTSARLEVANPERQPRSFLWPMGWTEHNKDDSCGSKRNLHLIWGRWICQKLSDDVGGGRLKIPEDWPLVRMERILVIQLGATGKAGTCNSNTLVR